MREIVLKIHPNDNVLVALTDLKKGQSITYEDNVYVLKEDIPAKHKFYLFDFNVGDSIYMYGTLVGKIQQPVLEGSRMTTDNLKHAAAPFFFRPSTYTWTPPDVSKFVGRTFDGYHRKDGRVGTQNIWLFIPAVFCENRNLDILKDALLDNLGYSITDKYKQATSVLRELYLEGADLSVADLSIKESFVDTKRLFKNVDGIKFLNHQGGCGGIRQDSEVLGKLLTAYSDHPNVAGITFLSLGCQHIQNKDFLTYLKEVNPNFDKPVYIFEQQTSKSEEWMMTEAIRQTFIGLAEANTLERAPAPISEMVLGVKCGGSDGFSGISANPALGYTADLLVGLGGKVLLAEFPELCGCEQDIIDRIADEKASKKFIDLMTTYNASAEAVGSGFYMNPSPGNIKDGLITDAIKSNGAAKKGGSAPIVDVLDYTEKATKAGLSLVCTPGNDVEATTGKVASGANVIVFTTGLGTPTGNPICPVVKAATNSILAERMADIIDFDCGTIITGEKTIQQVGEELLEYCIQVASGKIIPKAVLLQQDDFIPWKRGVSL